MCQQHQEGKIREVRSRENPHLYIDYQKLQFDLSCLPVALFIRFAVVGLGGVAVDLGMFALLHKPLGLALTPSAMLSTEVAIINNFLWNDVWTFSDVSQKQQSITQRLQRLFKFNLICFFGLILNSLIVNWLFSRFGVNEYIAKLVAIACITLWNFWLNLKLNWQVRQGDIEKLSFSLERERPMWKLHKS
ncbi:MULTISPECIES: GtrA family protein [unclassified Nostoc]|uniref:GtrA family protein n=1 Tax=unclassified Nostoc TaxID=2593658 RepID=UPI002AD1FBBB|nr:GtrA family protein [Nostoc sp. ChiQUE02]MDZ8234080.1 GtrA family protein [Nostoc sp. ChiQUE02]